MLINSHAAVWKKNEVLQDRVMRPWFVGRLLISLIVDWLLCFCSAALFIQSQMLVHWWWCWLCHWWSKLLRIGCATKLRHHLHPFLHWIVVVVDREKTVQCQSFIWMQPPNAYKYRVGLLWLQRCSDNVINSSLVAALNYGDWVEIPWSKLMVGDIVKICKSYHPCWIFWHHVQWSLD
jgi:hypothetical protein